MGRLKKRRFPWVLASGVAALAGMLLLLLVRVPSEKVPGAGQGGAGEVTLGLSRGSREHGNVMLEQMAVYDPTPLYLPTRWNSNEWTLLEPSKRTAGEAFEEVPPRLVFTEGKAPIAVGVEKRVPADAVEGLRMIGREGMVIELGRNDDSHENLPRRLGYLEMFEVGKGERIFSEVLVPPRGMGVLSAGLQDWQPMEFRGAVSEEGVVGGWMVTSSSGSEVVDDYFKGYLDRYFRGGWQLVKGFYLVRIGP